MQTFVATPTPLHLRGLRTHAPRQPPPYRGELCRRRPRATLPSPAERDALSERLRTGDQAAQMLALIALPRFAPEEAVSLLHGSGLLRSANRQVRLTAVATLGKLGVRGEARALLTVLRDVNGDEDYSVRAAAASALGWLLPPPGDEALVREATLALAHAATTEEHFIVRYAALVSLGNLGDAAALSTLLPIVKEEGAPPLEAAAAVGAVGEVLGREEVGEEVLSAVVRRARDREEFVRAAVARTLGGWQGVGEAGSVLRKMRVDEERYGQSEMVRAILADVSVGDDDIE